MSSSAFTPTVLQAFQDASVSQPGLINTTTQSFAGDKTFIGTTVLGGPVAMNWDGPTHKISGDLAVRTPTSPNADHAGATHFSTNIYALGGIVGNRFSTASGGIGFSLSSRTSDTGDALNFFSNKVGDGLTVDSSSIGYMTQGGQWVIGSNNPGSVQHKINQQLRFSSSSAFTTGSHLWFSSNALRLNGGSSGMLFSNENNSANYGAVTNAGAWTLGPSSGTANHKVRSGAATELQIESASGSNAYLRFLASGAGRARIFSSNTNGIVFSNSSDTSVGEFSDAGAWTIGPTSFLGTHTIRGNVDQFGNTFTQTASSTLGVIQVVSTVSNGGAELKANASASSGVSGAYLTLAANGNSANYINSAGSRPLFFIENGATTPVYGTMSSGSWEFGNPSFGAQHAMMGGAAAVAGAGAPLRLQNIFAGAGWKIGPDSTNNFVIFNNADTGAYIAYGSTSWTAYSDARMKKNIVDSSLGLNTVLSLRPVEFDYLTDDSEDSKRLGFIAQEVYATLPQAAHKPADEAQMMGVSATDMIPVLVKAIQELKAELDDAKQRIITLEALQ
jgi:hypothetical protein